MDRRRFIQRTGLVSTALLMPRFLRAAGRGARNTDRILVVVQLTGGNDGLNMVVPFGHDAYYRLRPKLGIPEAKVLRLNKELGLHPGMIALHRLHEDGLLTVVNGVGYPDPDRSHFRSMDIWHTASGSDQYLNTGWLGRYMDSTKALPHGVIEFSGELSLANKGENVKAIALTDAARFYNATREPYFADLAQGTVNHAEQHAQLGYLYRTMAETYESADHIHRTVHPRETTATYPKNDLARQLRQVSTFIQSGMDTRVYYTAFDGFDTHINQLQKQGASLTAVSEAIGAFVTDLRSAGRMGDVVVMVFSEFGRRAMQNASGGTDHGTASNVLLIGSGLQKPGIFNALPSLDHLDNNGDLRFSVDFRSVYATLLDRWLDQSTLGILPERTERLGLF